MNFKRQISALVSVECLDANAFALCTVYLKKNGISCQEFFWLAGKAISIHLTAYYAHRDIDGNPETTASALMKPVFQVKTNITVKIDPLQVKALKSCSP